MNDCIFCKIIKGEVPSHKVYEDDYAIVLLDIRPASKKGGHCLVIPKKHCALISDVDDKTLEKVSLIIKKISKVLLKKYEGLNLVQNNKEVAGQAIDHVHFHLIPRYKNDGILIEKWKSFKYGEGEAEKLVEEIKKLI